MSLNEKYLLKELSQGSEPAFKELFLLYRDSVFGYVYKLVKSRELAEEITMDIFAKIWNNRGLAGEIINLKSFLFKMASNKAIDFLRKASKETGLREILWEEIQIAGDLNPENYIFEKDLADRLAKVIDALPDQRKLIFKLSREEGLTYGQIGSRLKISKNTVRNQMVEALRFIRHQLNINKELLLLLLFLKNI